MEKNSPAKKTRGKNLMPKKTKEKNQEVEGIHKLKENGENSLKNYGKKWKKNIQLKKK